MVGDCVISMVAPNAAQLFWTNTRVSTRGNAGILLPYSYGVFTLQVFRTHPMVVISCEVAMPTFLMRKNPVLIIERLGRIVMNAIL